MEQSDTSQCSQESEGSNSESKIQIVIKGTHEAHNIYNPKGIAPTVREMRGKETKIIDSNVLVSQKSINTQTNSLQINSQILKTMEMQQKLTQVNFQTLICSVEDFLAKHSVFLEKETQSIN